MSAAPLIETPVEDVVDHVVGIAPGDRLDTIRRARPDTRNNIQAAHRALFGAETHGIAIADRHLVASFVAGLTDPGSAVAQWHRDRTTDPALLDRLLESAAQQGPWGTYREAKLAAAGLPGQWWQVAEEERELLGERLTAVLEHAHFLVLHPRDARPKVLATLAASGWDRPQIVTWSQLISFISFQVRLSAGFTVLAGEGLR
ncbi:MAG: CMD domain protein [Propionibacterium sp.]|nr:CMD domain protein [Propionibacterium sp.]